MTARLSKCEPHGFLAVLRKVHITHFNFRLTAYECLRFAENERCPGANSSIVGAARYVDVEALNWANTEFRWLRTTILHPIARDARRGRCRLMWASTFRRVGCYQ